MNKVEATRQTYEQAAAQLALRFNTLNRLEDIAMAMRLAPSSQPNVVELGCGNGKDAIEIIKQSGSYIGMDASRAMVRLAQRLNPQAEFRVAELSQYTFPDDIDLIFSFASLLHSPKDEIAGVLQRAHKALRPAGIFYVSLKQRPYQSEMKHDQFGSRLFYYYEPDDIIELGAFGYRKVFLRQERIGSTDWFVMALQKR